MTKDEMEFRDKFALSAIIGLLAGSGPFASMEFVVDKAYAIADLMLERRKKS